MENFKYFRGIVLWMMKVVKRWGEFGLGIYLNKEERKAFGYKEGQLVNVEITPAQKEEIEYIDVNDIIKEKGGKQ